MVLEVGSSYWVYDNPNGKPSWAILNKLDLVKNSGNIIFVGNDTVTEFTDIKPISNKEYTIKIKDAVLTMIPYNVGTNTRLPNKSRSKPRSKSRSNNRR